MEVNEEQNKQAGSTTRVEMQNVTCFVCNGFYGSSYSDPTCDTCHAFLYSTVVVKEDALTMVSEEDDSDSGNDEPLDNASRPVLSEEELNVNNEVHISNVENQQICTVQVSKIIPHINVNVEHLPTEVLIHIFGFLDDLSVWSVGQVNSRWRDIMNMSRDANYWKMATSLRWPLYKTSSIIHDWYELYTSLVHGSWCLKCLRQMTVRKKPTGKPSSWRANRLRTELRGLRADPPDGIQAMPLDAYFCHWQATIRGPVGSPYEGGTFFLYLQIPYTYPMSPPIVRFLTKIFHPNISRHGDIGIDSIHNNWSLALTISKVLISIQSLLTDPVCDVCMEPTIGNMYVDNKASFEEQARMWTWNFAMHQLYPH